MNPDNFKQAWQTQSSQSRVTINADLLLKEVRRNQRSFTAILFWRDVREVGIALALIPVWIYLGIKSSPPWTWYLMVPALVWFAGFMGADRMRHKVRLPGPGEPLHQSVECSLAQVNHQIWLLRNVLWWELMPLAVPILAFFGQVALKDLFFGWLVVLPVILVIVPAVLVFACVYWLNQIAVRSELEPRRLELEKLLASLKEEPPAAQG